MTRTFFGAELECRETEFVEAYIRAYGIWEPGVCDVLMRTLEHGDTFIDIGANIGHHTLLASHLVGPMGHVVAIEPEQGNHDALLANIALNSAKNIRVSRIAVGAQSGITHLYSGPEFNRGLATTVPLAHVDYAGRTAVTVKPLDEILSSQERRAARAIKIDIEGGEVSVLLQLLATLDGYPNLHHILAEVSEQTPIKLWNDLLKEAGTKNFQAFRIRNEYNQGFYNSWAGPEPLPPVSEVTGQCDLLLTRTGTLRPRARI